MIDFFAGLIYYGFPWSVVDFKKHEIKTPQKFFLDFAVFSLVKLVHIKRVIRLATMQIFLNNNYGIEHEFFLGFVQYYVYLSLINFY